MPSQPSTSAGSRPLLALGFIATILLAFSFSGLATTAEAVPPGGPVDRSNGAKVKINKKRVKAGSVIRVSGTNWRSKGSRVFKGRVVTIKLDDLHILGTLKINKKNRFAGNIRIPKRVAPGRHWLRFLAARPATSVKSPRFKVVR